MLMSMVIAVALGIAPVDQDGSVKPNTDYSSLIGHYSQVVDRHGTMHIKGKDRRGWAYDLVMTKDGYVEASVGERDISFHVQKAI